MRDLFRAGGFAFALLASAPSFAAPNVASVARDLAALTVAGPATTVENAKITGGHMTVTLTSGTSVPVKAGEETVGFFFSGKGTFEYRAVDPLELPLVVFTTKKASVVTPEKGDGFVAIKDSFTELLVLAANVPLPAAGSGAAAAPLDAAFAAHRETWARVEEPPPTHPFIVQRLDAPSAAALRLELAGGAEKWNYLFDGTDVPRERLDLVRAINTTLSDPEVKKRLWISPISARRDGDRKEPLPPTFRVVDVSYDLHASNGRDVSLTATETVVAVGRPRSVLAFGLDSLAWDQTQTGVVNLRKVRVKSVKTETGALLPFHHERGELLVGLPQPAPLDRAFKLIFEIEGDFLVRPQGDQFWSLEASEFLPMPPEGGGDFTLHSKVHVKKPFIPFAPGTTTSRKDEGDETVLETSLENPVDLPVVMAGNYKLYEETRDGLTIRVASYAMDRPNAFKKLANLAFTIVKYYEPFLGPFPVTELNIIEIRDFSWGQAPPGTLFITQEAFNPIMGMESELNQLFSQGVNHRFAHEIAHQYWGTAVKRASFEEQWLEEAFAEYCAALFIRDAKSKGDYEMLVATWKKNAKLSNDVAPIPLANRIEMPYDRAMQFHYRTGLLYGKGPYLLSSLHKQVGEETFLTFLKSYQKTFKGKHGSTKHVAGLLGFLTKKDFGPFFDANYWGMGMPKD
jgi:hypothetical protein